MATVSSSPRSTVYTLASAGAGPYLVGFRLFEADAIKVYVNNVASVDWALTASFTDGYDDAASITFSDAIEVGSTIQIDGDMAPRWEADYLPGDPGLVRKLNIDVARLWSSVSEIAMRSKRSVRFMDTVSPTAFVAGRVLMSSDDGIEFGPTADEVSAAQGYAEDSQAALSLTEAARDIALGAANTVSKLYPIGSSFIADGTTNTFQISGVYDHTNLIDLIVGGEAQVNDGPEVAFTVSNDGTNTDLVWTGTDGAGVSLFPKNAVVSFNASKQRVIDIGSDGYATRALFEAAVAGGLVVADGTIKAAGGLLYEARAVATELLRLPGWVPFGVRQPEHHGDVGSGDDAPLFQAALNAGGRIEARGASYTWTTTVTLPSGADLHLNDVPISTTNSLVLDYGSSIGAKVFGANFTGIHAGTSYMVRSDQPFRPVFTGKITNGNSGVDFARATGALVEFEAYQMRGTAGKLRGSTLSAMRLTRGENISGFGVLLESYDASTHSKNNRISFDKRVNAANLTAWQTTTATGTALYDAVNGRIGLEGLGIRVDNDSNVIEGGQALDTLDNGVSLTSNKNTGGNFLAQNCANDGLHCYGSYNSIAGVTCINNAQSGFGFGQGATTGTASYNQVSGVAYGNGWYGVNHTDIATGNTTMGSISNNTLSNRADTSSGANTVLPSAPVVDFSPTVTFATVGDFTPGYNERRAWYRIIDGVVHFSIYVRFTPIYTTASGEFRISGGLPAGQNTPVFPVGDLKNFTWPAGATQVSARLESGTIIRVRAFGPTLAATTLTTANVASGVEHTIQITGVYRAA